MKSFDAIIIGGGHNGLVAAGLLAKAGRQVIVLEASDAVGGGARTREFHPGYKASGLAHIVNRLAPEVMRTAAELTGRIGLLPFCRKGERDPRRLAHIATS